MEELSVKFEMVKTVRHSWRQSSSPEQRSRNGGKFSFEMIWEAEKQLNLEQLEPKGRFVFLLVYWLKLTN